MILSGGGMGKSSWMIMMRSLQKRKE